MHIKENIKKLTLLVKNRYNRHRCKMIDLAFDFCRHTKVKGDYFEFGVFQGSTFQYAFHAAKMRKMTDVKFFAFDSFQGFSEPKGSDKLGIVNQGERFCSLDNFTKNITKAGVDVKKVVIIPGWFENTLINEGKQITENKIGGSKVSVAWLDSDLYEPTLASLNFITDKLVDGSVLIFDNWFLFKGSPFCGERKAFEEWTTTNPQLVMTPYYNFSWHGTSFIVNLKVNA